jgi:hypothetical protein
LGRAGVRHLLVGSALRETAGNQHFQHLLGYRARNLNVEVTGPGTPLAEPVSRPAPDAAGVIAVAWDQTTCQVSPRRR